MERMVYIQIHACSASGLVSLTNTVQVYLRRKDRYDRLVRRSGALFPPPLLAGTSLREGHGHTLCPAHLTPSGSLVQETQVVSGHWTLVEQNNLSGVSGRQLLLYIPSS